MREAIAVQKSTRPGTPVISRTYANDIIEAVKQCWCWLLSEDLVPADDAASVIDVDVVR